MSELQKAKDSVYAALRAKLTVVNPQRTLATAEGTRPGIMVAENELETEAAIPEETFVLRWGGVTVTGGVARINAEIAFRVCGDEALSRQDRGRRAAAMNEELIVLCESGSAAIADHAQIPAVETGGRVLWSLAGIEKKEDRGERTGKVTAIFGWESEAQ